MLLKDFPVGSFVRLVSFDGDTDHANRNRWWKGSFEVMENSDGKYIIANDGDVYDGIDHDDCFQFEIVPRPKTEPEHTLTRNGKTYKLTPHVEKQTVTIDGVVYDMEEVE